MLVLAEDQGPQRGSGDKMDLIMDSGAFRSVLPADVATHYPLLGFPGEPPRVGRTATGQPLVPQGRRVLTCGFQAGNDKSLDFLVMDKVTRPLGSISQMVDRGCRVVFDSEEHGGSFIQRRASGEKHKIHARGGIFVLPVWVRKPAQGFPGQAALP